jgi:hypothetical protein
LIDISDPCSALRVEWCKALARSRRNNEELRILEEELGRTPVYADREAIKWQSRAELRTGLEPALQEGIRAYALEQAAMETQTATLLRTNWAPILAKAAAYRQGTDSPEMAEIVIDMEAEADNDGIALAEGGDDIYMLNHDGQGEDGDTQDPFDL